MEQQDHGKTTIGNLINRFYKIDSGKITIDGIDITKIPNSVLRSQITTVLQDSVVFSGTIKENIKAGKLNATDEEVIKAAKVSGADHFIEKLPEKYETVLNPEELSLSEGELQLLSIARAAISEPLVLILDEATSSVDGVAERLIQEGLDFLMKDTTTIVIAHRLSTIKNANAILLLENGKIVERGTHDDLLKEKGMYYNLHSGKLTLE